jgi:hypothetical protein
MEVIKVVQGGRKSFSLLMGEQMELAPWWLHLLHVKSRLPLFGPLNRVAARATVIAASGQSQMLAIAARSQHWSVPLERASHYSLAEGESLQSR